MNKYFDEVSVKFSKFLYERKLDKISKLKGKIQYSQYENIINEFCEKLFCFKNQFASSLEVILRKNSRVVYSNTPFISDYNYDVTSLFEDMAENILAEGIFDDLCKDINFTLTVTHDYAKLYVDYYFEGERKNYNVFEICHKDCVAEF